MSKFWFEDPSQLMREKTLLPTGLCSSEEQWNSVTRLSIVVFIIMIAATSFSYATIFLTISILLIIVLYYFQKRMKNKTVEYFSDYHKENFSNSGIVLTRKQLLPDASYITNNQQLLGGPNPKTLYAPIMVPPIASLSYWKSNDIAQIPQINELTYFEKGLSGYEETEENKKKVRAPPPPSFKSDVIQDIKPLEKSSTTLQERAVEQQKEENLVKEMFQNKHQEKQQEKRIKPKPKSAYGKINLPSDILNDPYKKDIQSQQVYSKPEYSFFDKSKKSDDPCAKLDIFSPAKCKDSSPTLIEPIKNVNFFFEYDEPETMEKINEKEFSRLKNEFRNPQIGRSKNVLDGQEDANIKFLDSTIDSRTNLMNSLMKKGNMNAEQVKKFPRMQQAQLKFFDR